MNLKKLVSFFLVFVLIGAYTFSYLSLKVYAIDNEYEQSVEKKTDNNESGIWEQARKDGCKDKFFHNAVQKYLVDLDIGYGRELPIQYNQLVENPITKRKTNSGSADIYKKIDDEKIDGVELSRNVQSKKTQNLK